MCCVLHVSWDIAFLIQYIFSQIGEPSRLGNIFGFLYIVIYINRIYIWLLINVLQLRNLGNPCPIESIILMGFFFGKPYSSRTGIADVYSLITLIWSDWAFWCVILCLNVFLTLCYSTLTDPKCHHQWDAGAWWEFSHPNGPNRIHCENP